MNYYPFHVGDYAAHTAHLEPLGDRLCGGVCTVADTRGPMNTLEFHPAAEIPTPLVPDDYAILRLSIATVGLQRPILLFDGKIIDGRNRYKICLELNIEPRFEAYSGNLSPLDLVKANLAHRHMTAGQKAEVGLRIESFEAELAKERQKAAGGNHGNQYTKVAVKADLPQAADDPPPKKKRSKQSRDKAAKASGASARNVSTQKKLRTKAPDLAEKVAAGEVSINAADRQLKEREQKGEMEKVISIALPDGLYIGDFRELASQIADNSVDLIFTDPPYDRKALPLYSDAARIAARILKPGGSFIAYTGQINLPGVLNLCGEHLKYFWTIAATHSGGNNLMNKYGIRCGWKPLVWCVKDYRADINNIVLDVVSGGREKSSHEWQQAEFEAAYYIEKLTMPGGVVVDFFGGGGTTMVSALALGRRCIMFETNPASVERIAARLAS